MPVIQSLLDDLKAIGELHQRKNNDYASNSNPFLNFDITESILEHFNNPRDQTFVWPIANKLGRLANLLSRSDPPNYESIEDSLLDIATYTLLWKADIQRRNSMVISSKGSGYSPTTPMGRCHRCGIAIANMHHLRIQFLIAEEHHNFCSLACVSKYLKDRVFNREAQPKFLLSVNGIDYNPIEDYLKNANPERNNREA